jgi:hypothetical protein
MTEGTPAGAAKRKIEPIEPEKVDVPATPITPRPVSRDVVERVKRKFEEPEPQPSAPTRSPNRP